MLLYLGIVRFISVKKNTQLLQKYAENFNFLCHDNFVIVVCERWLNKISSKNYFRCSCCLMLRMKVDLSFTIKTRKKNGKNYPCQILLDRVRAFT